MERMAKVSHAASLMGRRSVQARIRKWGRREFLRRMQERRHLARVIQEGLVEVIST